LSDYNSAEDRDNFLRIAQGDEQAFAAVFFRYTAKIYPFVLSKTKSQAAAEEIVQDVFLKLWTKRDLISNIESPASYLMRIATNRTLDYLRHKAVEHKVMQNIAESGPHNYVENEILFKDAKRILEGSISKMPVQRRTIYLLQQEGFSYDEIAERLSISSHTVRNHLAHATKFLRESLKEQGLSLIIILLLNGR